MKHETLKKWIGILLLCTLLLPLFSTGAYADNSRLGFGGDPGGHPHPDQTPLPYGFNWPGASPSPEPTELPEIPEPPEEFEEEPTEDEPVPLPTFSGKVFTVNEDGNAIDQRTVWEDIVQICGGKNGAYAIGLKADGTLVCTEGPGTPWEIKDRLLSLKDVVQIETAEDVIYVLEADGKVKIIENFSGPFEDSARKAQANVDSWPAVKTIAGCSGYVCGVTAEGDLFASFQPGKIVGFGPVRDISCCDSSIALVLEDGSVITVTIDGTVTDSSFAGEENENFQGGVNKIFALNGFGPVYALMEDGTLQTVLGQNIGLENVADACRGNNIISLTEDGTAYLLNFMFGEPTCVENVELIGGGASSAFLQYYNNFGI